MKTISGAVVSTKPISLSKAAKVLSTFVASADTGASQAVSTYLRRASESFSELTQLHKELKSSNTGHNKHEKHRKESVKHGNSISLNENPNDEVGRNVEDSVRKRDKKKKKKKMGSEDVSGGNVEIEVGESKEMKKRKSGVVDDGEVIDLGEQSNSKRKKKNRKMEEGDL